MQTAIDEQTKTTEALNQTVRLLCEQIFGVSTYKIDAVRSITDVR